MTERLTKSDWLNEGLRTLTAEGVAGLKVGPMADRLSVSRGSFYWHFADIGDLRAQLLEHWRDEATEQVIRRLEADAGPDRFKALLRGAFVYDRRRERAIRAWAAVDAEVAESVVAVDARRIAYIADMLMRTGLDRTTAAARARFVYWAFLGQPHVADPDGDSISVSDIEAIADLMTARPTG